MTTKGLITTFKTNTMRFLRSYAKVTKSRFSSSKYRASGYYDLISLLFGEV